MIAKSLLFLASLALAAAAPQAGRGGPTRTTSSCSTRSPTSTAIALPVNGGGKELAAPDNLELKYVVLGHGYQNYTCDANNTSNSSGALAVLYDLTPFHPGHERAVRSVEDWLAIAKICSYTKDVPLQLDGASTGTRVAGAEKPVKVASPFFNPIKPLSLSGVKGELKPVGVHYFDSNKVPTFELGSDLFKSTKLDSINAPASAAPGQKGEKAVSWLYLGDNGSSKGIDFVYRVNTVGGSGHTCNTAGDDSTEYTAFYYMYKKKA